MLVVVVAPKQGDLLRSQGKRNDSSRISVFVGERKKEKDKTRRSEMRSKWMSFLVAVVVAVAVEHSRRSSCFCREKHDHWAPSAGRNLWLHANSEGHLLLLLLQELTQSWLFGCCGGAEIPFKSKLFRLPPPSGLSDCSNCSKLSRREVNLAKIRIFLGTINRIEQAGRVLVSR